MDRVNNSGNYEPGNVEFRTAKEQCRNKRNNRILTVRGVTDCLTVLCHTFNVTHSQIYNRLRLGWPLELAFFAPKFYRLKSSDINVPDSNQH